jgi:hypothetical protein
MPGLVALLLLQRGQPANDTPGGILLPPCARLWSDWG